MARCVRAAARAAARAHAAVSAVVIFGSTMRAMRNGLQHHMPVVIIPLLVSGVKLRLTAKAGLLYLRVLRIMRSVGKPLHRDRGDRDLRLRYLRSFCALQSLRKDGHRRHGAEIMSVLLHESLGVEQNQGELGGLWCGIPAWYRERGLNTMMKICIDTIEQQVYEWPEANGYQV